MYLSNRTVTVLWAAAARRSLHHLITHRCRRFFSRPLDPDLLCGPPYFLFSANRSGGKGYRGVKLTNHLHQQLILWMNGPYLFPPPPNFSMAFTRTSLILLYKWHSFFFFGGATARDGPWPPLQYASRPLDPLLCLSIPSSPRFSGPWTRHPAISFLVFLFVLLHTAFGTSFLELRCLAFFLCDQAIVFFAI